MPATAWGSAAVAAGTTTGTTPASASTSASGTPVAFGTAVPTLTVDNQALIVTDPAAAPTKVAGQAVTTVVDEVTFMPGYTPSGTVSGVVQIDRTAGTIRALSGSTGLPEDRTGSGSWVVEGLAAPPASSTAPVTVTLDLAGVTKALGVPLDASGTGLGLRRKVTLADGSVVVGLPVTATVGWFQTAAVPIEAPPGTLALEVAASDATGATSNAVPALVAAGVVVVVLVVVALVFMVRRRRRVATVQTELFGESGPEPRPEVTRAPSLFGREAPVSVPVEPVEKVIPPAPGDEEHDGQAAGEDEDAVPHGPARRPGGRSPADVLAALDAEVLDLSARVERLGGPDPDAPPATGPSGR